MKLLDASFFVILPKRFLRISSLRKEEFRVHFVQGACVWQMATVCLEIECFDLCTGVCTHTHVYICTASECMYV